MNYSFYDNCRETIEVTKISNTMDLCKHYYPLEVFCTCSVKSWLLENHQCQTYFIFSGRYDWGTVYYFVWQWLPRLSGCGKWGYRSSLGRIHAPHTASCCLVIQGHTFEVSSLWPSQYRLLPDLHRNAGTGWRILMSFPQTMVGGLIHICNL